MRTHALAVGAVVGVALANAVATSAGAQDMGAKTFHGGGELVWLTSIGAHVKLPAEPAGWSIRSGVGSADKPADMLKPSRADGEPEEAPHVLWFAFQTVPTLHCAEVPEKRIDDSYERIDDVSFLPASWQPWAYAKPGLDEGTTNLSICMSTKGGALLGTVLYRGAVSELDPARLKPLLEEVGKAVAGVPIATALPTTGITIALPRNWSVRAYHDAKTGETVDFLDRKAPKTPFLTILLLRTAECGLGGEMMTQPAWLPPAWGSQGVQHYAVDSDGFETAKFCSPTDAGDWIIGAVSYKGSLSAPELMEMKPILAAILAPLRTADAAPTDDGSDAADDDGEAEDADETRDARYGVMEIGIVQFDSGIADADKALGGVLAMNGFGILHAPGKIVGVAGKLGGYMGMGKESWYTYDAQVGAGPGVHFDALAIAPLIGVGFDGAPGSDTTVAKFDITGYWYVGGEAKISVPKLSFVLGGQYITRVSEALNREARFSVRVLTDDLSLGFLYTAYGTTEDRPEGSSAPKAIQGTFGVRF